MLAEVPQASKSETMEEKDKKELIEFSVWYSGMSEDSVKRAYERWKMEHSINSNEPNEVESVGKNERTIEHYMYDCILVDSCMSFKTKQCNNKCKMYL